MEISVVIPLYNKEKHIQNTIETVLRQTYKNFEICIIDDGSTDSGASIVEQIQDTRIRLIKKPNEGVSKTRNYGVSIAKNEFIAFMDADDEWKETYLEEIVELITKYPEAAIYATNYEIVEKSGEPNSLSFPDIYESFDNGLINNYFISAYHYTPLWTSAVVIRKSVFMLLGGFPTDIKNGEDLDLWLSLIHI
jgi:glycosyltransferase involved in cell wall biosynthesis